MLTLKIIVVLRINSINLSVDRVFEHKRTNEEGGESVKCFFKVIVSYLKLVVCISKRGICVCFSTSISHKLTVGVLIRVLLSTHKKHVFAKVSKTIIFRGVKT